MKRRRSSSDPIDALRTIGILVDYELEDDARQFLQRVSLYRLLPYAEHLLEGCGERCAHWSGLMELYERDRSLRMLFFSAIERIEVALRAQIDGYMRANYGADYLERGELYMGEGDARTRRELQRIRPLPALEGAYLSHLYHLCRTLTNPNDAVRIAMYFALPKEVFVSWLHALSYVRNLCAHHYRLIGVRMQSQPKRLLYSRRLRWLTEGTMPPLDSLDYMAHIVDYLLQTVEPGSHFLRNYLLVGGKGSQTL